MAIAIASTMSAQADVYLDGLMSADEMIDWQSDIDNGDDVSGLFEFKGSFYDTFVDTSINLNNNVLFETYQTTTLLTDTGASSIYQTGVAQTVESILESLVNSGNRDFGFNAKIIGGTVQSTQGDRNVLFTEQANGNYISNELNGSEYNYEDVMYRIGNRITNMVVSTDKFTKGRMVVPTEWNGITADDIVALNKDKITSSGSYTVKKGEGLWAVVHNSGTDLTYEEIYELNPGLKERGYLGLGEVIKLDSFKEGSLVNIKEWTERDLENKSSKTDVIDEDDYLAEVYADAPGSDSNSKFVGRTVQQGEGVWSSANALGVSYDELYTANEGVEGRYLRTGEVLFSGTITFVDAVKTVQPENNSIGGKSLEIFPVIDVQLGMGDETPNVPGVNLGTIQSILNTIMM